MTAPETRACTARTAVRAEGSSRAGPRRGRCRRAAGRRARSCSSSFRLGRMPVIRPMTLDDVRPAMELTGATFDDLSRRMGEEPEPPPPDLEAAALRYRAFVTHDPEGSWVAEDEQGLAGCALAVKREGIWGLSLLIVRPGLQSAGVGSELLRRAHDYAHDAKGRIIMASPDPRAIRAYSRLGLELHPCFSAAGTPRDVRAPAELREGTAQDVAFTEEVDRFARGGGRRSSIETLL